MDWAAARVGVERALKKKRFLAVESTDAELAIWREVCRMHRAELTTKPSLRFDSTWANPLVLQTRDMSIVEYKRKD